MTQIFTHRGLDPSHHGAFLESSYEAFEDLTLRGFGLEVDLQFTHEGEIVILHDTTLERLTHGADTRKVADLSLEEIKTWEFKGCHLTHFDELFSMFLHCRNSGLNRDGMLALHLKAHEQTERNLAILLRKIAEHYLPPEWFIIFDLTPESAEYLKRHNPALQLAASVAHPYDIERYNAAVGGTLLTVEELLEDYEGLYSWAWLDEWDLADAYRASKKLYTEEIISNLHYNGIKTAIISPELHATSPGLLGGESHPDAQSHERLEARIREILAMKPDAICTDYPDNVRTILEEQEPAGTKFFEKIKKGKLGKTFSPLRAVGARKKFADFSLTALEHTLGRYVSVHTRPILAKDYVPGDMPVRQTRGALVMQGPLLKKDNFTLETIKLYQKNFSDSSIVLSTWDDEDPKYLEACRNAGATVVQSSKPKWNGPVNANYQITSTIAGIRAAEKLGAQYILKTRTDQRMYGQHLMQFLISLVESFPVQGGYAQKGRIVTLNYGTGKYYPYHFSDLFLFGTLEDMKSYWDFPLLTPSARVPYFNTEVHVPAAFLKKTGRNLTWTIRDSWDAFAQQCIVIDRSMVDFYWRKHKRFREYNNREYRQEARPGGNLSFHEWFNLYREGAPEPQRDPKAFFRGLALDSNSSNNK